MICIYHSIDLDGWMSAAIVKLKYPDVELLGWNYGQSIPDWESRIDGHRVVMVDISFPPEIMMSYHQFNDLIWIDHHISAIKDLAEVGGQVIPGIRDTSKAACELTWEYFFPEQEMPELVRLLGRYDCFGHKGTHEERRVMEFQYGARQIITSAESALISLRVASESKRFDDVICSDILRNGVAIYNYLLADAQNIYKRIFPISIDGYKFACVNQDRFNPASFGIDYHADGYDGFACFWYNGRHYNYSLYNDNGKVDCSELAKARGGGGHRGASGFRTNEIIKQNE